MSVGCGGKTQRVAGRLESHDVVLRLDDFEDLEAELDVRDLRIAVS